MKLTLPKQSVCKQSNLMNVIMKKIIQTRLFMLTKWSKKQMIMKMRSSLLLVQQCKQETKQARSGYTKLLTIAKGEFKAASLMMPILKIKMESLRL
jgi:hypothetical protein